MSQKHASYPISEAADIQVRSDAPLLKGIEAINISEARIALVTDAKGRMIGSLVDGDVRRALLAGFTAESPVSSAMHTTPLMMPVGSTRYELLECMRSQYVKQIPLLKPSGTVAGIVTYDNLIGFGRVPRSNPVVIMAGGKGKRLLPLTQERPKPMLEVGDKPMLEHILQHFIRQGFSQFHISLNYLGHVIEEYFGNGEKWKCRIDYIRESDPLGTAGSLSLMAVPDEPMIVINGDILTTADFCHLLDYHVANNSAATVCARAHRVEVPYGVLQIKDGMMQAIVEKPVYEDLVSAGIYVLSPEALRYVPKGRAVDMPELLQTLVENKKKVAIFPMQEEWADVGKPDDLDKAQRHFASGS